MQRFEWSILQGLIRDCSNVEVNLSYDQLLKCGMPPVLLGKREGTRHGSGSDRERKTQDLHNLHFRSSVSP